MRSAETVSGERLVTGTPPDSAGVAPVVFPRPRKRTAVGVKSIDTAVDPPPSQETPITLGRKLSGLRLESPRSVTSVSEIDNDLLLLSDDLYH